MEIGDKVRKKSGTQIVEAVFLEGCIGKVRKDILEKL